MIDVGFGLHDGVAVVLSIDVGFGLHDGATAVLPIAPAFAVTVPVDRRPIGRELGHAVVHAHH